jgi:ubiquinone/menaquinone biosynthesis C-methylase UbiE
MKQKIVNLIRRKLGITHINKRIERLECELRFMTSDRWNHWLWVNKTERMDATLDIFDEKRRNFHLDRYQFATKHVTGKRVLDCACGTGYGAELLMKAGAGSVIGIDIDEEAIGYAEKKHSLKPDGAYIIASATSTGLDPESVDVICSFETLEHLDDESGLLSEFARILVPGGLLIISTPNQWPLAIAPYHVREYDYDSFVGCAGSQFEVIRVYSQNSGSDGGFNRNQQKGIAEVTNSSRDTAECFIGVFQKI